MNRLTGWLCLALLAAACIWAAVYHLTIDILPYEDSYIALRSADQLAAGHGLVYNPGEPVLVCTSPLYGAWLALIRIIAPGEPTPLLAVRGNLLLFLLAVGAVTGLARTLSGSSPLGLLTGALFAAHPAMQALSSGGKETFLFVGLMAAAAWACAAGRFPLAALLGSLTLPARPEGVIVIGLVALAWWLGGRPRPGLFGTLLLAPAGLWVVMATLAYGSPVPNPVAAKLLPVFPVPPAYALHALVGWFGRWSLPAGLPEVSPLRDISAMLLAEAGAAGLLLHPGVRRRGGWIAAALLNAFFLFYALLNPMLFDWYTANLFPFWMIGILIGLPALGEVLSGGTPREPIAPGVPKSGREGGARKGRPRALRVSEPLLTALAAVVMAGSLLIPYTGDVLMGRNPTGTARTAVRLRAKAYREAALWLNRLSPRGGTLAAPESGAVGYYWNGRVLDTSGLASPEALPYLPVPAGQRADLAVGALPIAIPLELIQVERPEFIVTLEVYAAGTLLQSDWFLTTYRPLREFELPKSLWGCNAVLVYQRSDLPPPPRHFGEEGDEAGEP